MKSLLRLTAILMIAIMSVAGCKKDDDGKGLQSPVAGKFASSTGSGEAVFYADNITATKAGKSEMELVGKIKDGDLILTLKGVHNNANNRFYLSAGSGSRAYSIVGTYQNGNMTETEATTTVKSGDDWTEYTASVTSVNPETVTIDGSASSAQVEGIPSSWFGTWKGGDQTFTLTALQFVDNILPQFPAKFLDIVPLSNVKFEMIMKANSYYEDLSPAGTEYMKVWLEQAGKGLTLTLFLFEEDEDEPNGYVNPLAYTYHGAKLYDTANPEWTATINLTRP